ncbi:MAG: hypothetical protein IKK59_03490 [Lachnospiraceae bacterium]|nr:hypothetical protein [Lachnospiraceae bacterium]
MFDMNEKEMIDKLIDKYIDLQRIKKSDNPEKEVDYQLTIAKAKLESFGIVTENLEIK